jgi:predicted RNase H-like HicB family nuclease
MRRDVIIQVKEHYYENFHCICRTGPGVGVIHRGCAGVPGAHTQAATLDELQSNLKEVLELCLEENKNLGAIIPKFIGLQQIEIAARQVFPLLTLKRWKSCYSSLVFKTPAAGVHIFSTVILMAERPLFPIIRGVIYLVP